MVFSCAFNTDNMYFHILIVIFEFWHHVVHSICSSRVVISCRSSSYNKAQKI